MLNENIVRARGSVGVPREVGEWQFVLLIDGNDSV